MTGIKIKASGYDGWFIDASGWAKFAEQVKAHLSLGHEVDIHIDAYGEAHITEVRDD